MEQHTPPWVYCNAYRSRNTYTISYTSILLFSCPPVLLSKGMLLLPVELKAQSVIC